MNILHVISTLNIGGAENFVVQLANEQNKSNNVSIIVLGVTNPEQNYIDSINNRISLVELNWKKKYSIIQFLKLNSLIKQLAPDVIFVHLHNPLYYIYGISFLKPKTSFIHTVHSSFNNWKFILRYMNMFRFLNNKILHVCVAPSIYEDLKENFPKLKSKMIRNGINEYIPKRREKEIQRFWNKFSITPSYGVRFLAIGNISKHKNYKLLSLSFKSIYKSYPKAMCIQIGKYHDNVLREELVKIGAKNVFFAGQHKNAADFLKESDALVISSIQEGMPIVALEALSMGVPVISTPAGGMKDIVIDGYNGYIINDFEVMSFQQVIHRFISLSNEQKQNLKKNAKASFDEFYRIKQIEALYRTNYVCNVLD